MYAIVDEPPENRALLGRGISRQPLSLVRAGTAFVVVEKAEAHEATPPAIVAYDRVIRRIARLSPATLPLRFGSTAPDRAAVQALVTPVAALVEHSFERVRNAVQFTMRVSGRRAPKVRRSGSSRGAAAKRSLGPGTRWLAERIAVHRVPEIENLTEATRTWVREVRVERHDRPPLLATVYHLVSKRDVRAWRAAHERAVAELPSGVTVTTTGPWPPYAFAELG
jgi:hypothetical protein